MDKFKIKFIFISGISGIITPIVVMIPEAV